MTDRRNDEFLDQLLDASLAEYSRAEKPVGLEARVLRRIEEERPRRFAWLGSWQWAAAGAFAVLVIAAAVVIAPRQRMETKQSAQVPAAATAPGAATSKQSETIAASNAPASPEVRTRKAPLIAAAVPPAVRVPRFNRVRPDARLQAPAVVAAAPRLAVFPAPAPLSEQEALLARAASSGNPAVLKALAAAQEPIKDLEIAPLKIEPLPGSPQTENPGSKPNP